MITAKYKAVFIWVPLIVALSGCGSSPPTRLYRLEPIAVASNMVAETELTISVASVILPAYLNRKEIVSQDERYRISAAEYDRWAEPLEDNIRAVLTENLSALVPAARVLDGRSETGYPADYVVHVRVISFGAEVGGDVRLSASWIIDDVAADSAITNKISSAESPTGADVVATVAAMSATLESLSQRIADDINSHSVKQEPR